jgi:hypothetical protein
MPYRYQNSKGQTYYLHGKEVTLQNDRKQQIFYFAREAKPGEALDAVPAGKAIIENPRTGLPFLKGAAAVSPAKAPSTRPATRGAKTGAGVQRTATRR